jgi:glyoxylate carboligase
MEGAQVPWAFRKAFHLMREGRPGPVHIDLPIEVQREVIEYDPDADGPPEVVKPNRGAIEKALAMLLDAERPLIVTGGGVSFVEIAREWDRAARIRRRNAWVAKVAERKRTMLRSTDFEDVPIKSRSGCSRRSTACSTRTAGFVTAIGLGQIASGQLQRITKPRNYIICGQAGPVGWTSRPRSAPSSPIRKPRSWRSAATTRSSS